MEFNPFMVGFFFPVIEPFYYNLILNLQNSIKSLVTIDNVNEQSFRHRVILLYRAKFE